MSNPHRQPLYTWSRRLSDYDRAALRRVDWHGASNSMLHRREREAQEYACRLTIHDD